MILQFNTARAGFQVRCPTCQHFWRSTMPPITQETQIHVYGGSFEYLEYLRGKSQFYRLLPNYVILSIF